MRKRKPAKTNQGDPPVSDDLKTRGSRHDTCGKS